MWYLLVQNGAEWQQTFFPLTSTRWKQSNAWLAAICAERLQTPDGRPWRSPLFWRAWTLETIANKNKKGDWWTFRAQRGLTLIELDPSKQLLELAKAFSLGAQAANLRLGADRYDGPTIEGHAVRPPGREPFDGAKVIGEPLPH